MDPAVDDSSALRHVSDALLLMYSDDLYAQVAEAVGHSDTRRPPLMFIESTRNPPIARLYVVYVPNGKSLASAVSDGRLQPLLRQQDDIPLFVLALRSEGAPRLAEPNALTPKHAAVELYGRADATTNTYVFPANAVNVRAVTMWIEQLLLALP